MPTQIKEHSIIFQADMVKAILDNRKLQTRRTWGLEVINLHPDSWHVLWNEGDLWAFSNEAEEEALTLKCPYGQVGDRLHLKESCKLTRVEINGEEWVKCEYRFDYRNDGGFRYFKWNDIPQAQRKRLNRIRTWGKWRSGRFMYKFLARILLEITDIRVERLNQITEGDVIKEGVDNLVTFMLLWDKLNKERGYGWKNNCWVWVITSKLYQ